MGAGSDWCILRTSAGRTLGLTASLIEAGVDAWTPTQTVKRRIPRTRDHQERDAPIMPTFVFARACHLPELARTLALPGNPHPAFSIFRYAGRIPLLADREMASLRAAEERARVAKLKAVRHVFPIGQEVRVAEGVAAGMAGVVEAGDGTFALVAFGGTFRMKIATFLLRTDEVQAVAA